MTNFRLPWQQRVRMQREQEAERHALSCYCGFRTQHNKIFHFASSCITYHGTAHVSFVSVLGDAHRWYSHKSAYLKQRGREQGRGLKSYRLPLSLSVNSTTYVDTTSRGDRFNWYWFQFHRLCDIFWWVMDFLTSSISVGTPGALYFIYTVLSFQSLKNLCVVGKNCNSL